MRGSLSHATYPIFRENIICIILESFVLLIILGSVKITIFENDKVQILLSEIVLGFLRFDRTFNN